MCGTLIAVTLVAAIAIWGKDDAPEISVSGERTIYRANHASTIYEMRVAILAPTLVTAVWLFLRRSPFMKGLLFGTGICALGLMVLAVQASRTTVVVAPEWFAAPEKSWYGVGGLRTIRFAECVRFGEAQTSGRRRRLYQVCELRSGEWIYLRFESIRTPAWWHVVGNAKEKGIPVDGRAY
jgi:hypothetical protein